MKLLKHISTAVIFILLFSSCDKQESLNDSLEGVYEGYLNPVDFQSANPEKAQANVTIIGDHLIQVRCYSETLDTVFHLNYYKHYNEYMVCLTGDNFFHRYGHPLYHENMSPGMMGNNTEWMYHLEQQHSDADEHFGRFSMTDHSFEYLFEANDQNHTAKLRFQGIRK